MSAQPHEPRTLPVVDLAASLAPNESAREAAARRLGDICCDTGFFYITGHGVSPPLLAAQFARSREFFALPVAQRMALHMKHSRGKAGYEPLGGQTLDGSSPPDLKESFYVNADMPATHPYVGAGLRGYGGNQWPAGLPGFRAQMLGWHARMSSLGAHLMGLLARSLQLPEDYFSRFYSHPCATLRLIRYPPHPGDALAGQLGAGVHTDWGGLTLLAQDDTGGLEVQDSAGRWIAAPPLPGSFVVNLGDLMARWTNGIYHSNPHRVRNASPRAQDRYSVAFFYSPDHRARIEALPGCVSDARPARHAPCTSGDHMDEKFRQSYGDSAGPLQEV
jgi:isopenicillin N synthase-like dioxygenase